MHKWHMNSTAKIKQCLNRLITDQHEQINAQPGEIQVALHYKKTDCLE